MMNPAAPTPFDPVITAGIREEAGTAVQSFRAIDTCCKCGRNGAAVGPAGLWGCGPFGGSGTVAKLDKAVRWFCEGCFGLKPAREHK